MTLRARRGVLRSLALACHPLPTAAMTLTLTVAAALTGRSPAQCLLVALTVLSGQVTIGWLNDLVDADRDRRAGRRDKPVALGRLDPGAVHLAIAAAVLLVIPLSIANGTPAGLAHLGLVVSGWLYDLVLKRTALSWLPYVVGFGLIPAFLSYGGLGAGVHGSSPTPAMTVLAGVLGVGIHFLNALPDLEEDTELGVHHLPLRLARCVGAPRLLVASAVVTGLASLGIVITGLTVGVGR